MTTNAPRDYPKGIKPPPFPPPPPPPPGYTSIPTGYIRVESVYSMIRKANEAYPYRVEGRLNETCSDYNQGFEDACYQIAYMIEVRSKIKYEGDA